MKKMESLKLLKSISCEKLIKSPLIFASGLNAVVGADDAHNSIGKSSILMLIDFAFGGSDFPSKCDDVIRNVGNFKVGTEFQFDKLHSFIRDTESPNAVYRVDSQDFITLEEFNDFLKQQYIPQTSDITFRDCVSGFFRVYQRNNYNDKRPLDASAKENWVSIRKRILKIFGKYSSISSLEHEKKTETNKLNDIKGTFNSGVVEKINKTKYAKNEIKLLGLRDEIETIKNTLKNNVTDIKSIINDKNLKLKTDKDKLIELKFKLETNLARINSNLSGNNVRNSKSFQSVVEFFPEIDRQRLLQVESFHQGISKILKNQLKTEKNKILETISIAENDLAEIDSALLKIVGSKEEAVYLLEHLMELDRNTRDLKQQNDFWEKSDRNKLNIKAIQKQIEEALKVSIAAIEETLNTEMKLYINRLYDGGSISPTMTLDKGNYSFNHGDDRGTGKGYANMIVLDLAFLHRTCLPCLIHDSLLFKNMDIPAVEHLLDIYSSFDKQIFIAIDEKSKYGKTAQAQIGNSMFLQLDKNRLAFNMQWKKTGD
jgi:hypothetical protein